MARSSYGFKIGEGFIGFQGAKIGSDFVQHLPQNIFEPAGLQNTGVAT